MDREESPRYFPKHSDASSQTKRFQRNVQSCTSSTTMNGDTCSLSSFLAPLKSYEKLHSNKGFPFHFIMRNDVESNSPLIFLKYMGTPVATPPENHFYFFLIKPSNQTKPWVNPNTVTTKWFDCQEAGKTKSSGNLLIKILRASESLGSSCYKGRSSFSKLWMQFQP